MRVGLVVVALRFRALEYPPQFINDGDMRRLAYERAHNTAGAGVAARPDALVQPGLFEELLNNGFSVLLPGGCHTYVDEIQPGIIALVRYPTPPHDNGSERQRRLNRELRLVLCRRGGVIVDHVLQDTGNGQQVLRHMSKRPGRRCHLRAH